MTHQSIATSTLNTAAQAVEITSLWIQTQLGDVAMVTLTAATASSRPRDPQLIIRVRTPIRHTLKDKKYTVTSYSQDSVYQRDVFNSLKPSLERI